MAGDEVTGATTFRLVEELDAGPTYGLFTETIRADDTAGDLLDRLAEYGAGLLVATLDGIEDGDARGAAADRRAACRSRPKLTVEDARDRLDPAGVRGRPARSAAARRRPARGRRSAAQRLKVGPVARLATDDELGPGELADRQARRCWSAPAPHAVELGEVQPPGKPRMRAADWARGLRDRARSRLGDHDARDAPRRGREPRDDASTRPVRRRTTSCARSTTDDAYLNLVLPRLLGERGLTGRDAAFATELAARDRAAAGQLRRDPGRAASRAASTTLEPAVLDGAAARRAPAAQHAGAVARRGRHDASSWSGPTVGRAPGADGQRGAARVGGQAARRVAGPRSRRRGRPTWSGTSPCGTRTRAGSSTRSSTPAGDEDEARGSCSAPTTWRRRSRSSVRPGLARVDELLADGGAPGRWSPYAGVARRRRPGRDPGRARPGRAGVQDEGSQLVALALAAADGRRVATSAGSTCAPGPGGKAALLAGLARERGAALVARRAAAASGRRWSRRRCVATGPPATVVAADGIRAAVARRERSTG